MSEPTAMIRIAPCAARGATGANRRSSTPGKITSAFAGSSPSATASSRIVPHTQCTALARTKVSSRALGISRRDVRPDPDLRAAAADDHRILPHRTPGKRVDRGGIPLEVDDVRTESADPPPLPLRDDMPSSMPARRKASNFCSRNVSGCDVTPSKKMRMSRGVAGDRAGAFRSTNLRDSARPPHVREVHFEGDSANTPS